MEDAPVLRARLAAADSRLAAQLAEAASIAQNEWLPALTTNSGSSNAYPHLRNVAGYLEQILLAFEGFPESGFAPLSQGEIYVALLAVLFHDYGRLDPKTKGDKGVPHGERSRVHLTQNHAHLGVHLREVAELIGKIAECHEPKVEGEKTERVATAIGYLRDTTIDPLGTIRAPLLAALLALADQMDSAYTRAIPEYLTNEQDGVIGMFRRHIRGIYVDPQTRLVTTVLTMEDACQQNEGNVAEYALEVEKDEQNKFLRASDKFVWEDKVLESTKEQPKSVDFPAIGMSYRSEGPPITPAWLGRGSIPPLLKMLATGKLRLSRASRKDHDKRVLVTMPKYGPQAIAFGNMHENHNLLRQVHPVLAQYGISLDAWLVDVDGCLYTRSSKFSYEPTVTVKLLCDATTAMWDLSTRVFGGNTFTYEDVAAYLGDPFVPRVRTACRRVANLAAKRVPSLAGCGGIPWAGVANWHWHGTNIGKKSCKYTAPAQIIAQIIKSTEAPDA